MKISRDFLNMANAVKLISGIILIGLIFSILPTVLVCMPTSHTELCIVKIDVCHASTEGIQKSIDAPVVHESAYLSASMHYVGGYTASSFTPSPLLIVFQDYPPPESAS